MSAGERLGTCGTLDEEVGSCGGHSGLDITV